MAVPERGDKGLRGGMAFVQSGGGGGRALNQTAARSIADDQEMATQMWQFKGIWAGKTLQMRNEIVRQLGTIKECPFANLDLSLPPRYSCTYEKR